VYQLRIIRCGTQFPLHSKGLSITLANVDWFQFFSLLESPINLQQDRCHIFRRTLSTSLRNVCCGHVRLSASGGFWVCSSWEKRTWYLSIPGKIWKAHTIVTCCWCSNYIILPVMPEISGEFFIFWQFRISENKHLFQISKIVISDIRNIYFGYPK